MACVGRFPHSFVGDHWSECNVKENGTIILENACKRLILCYRSKLATGQNSKAKFRVSIYSLRCFVELPPQQFYVQNCVATLENLQFSCEYSVGVEDADNKRIFESLTFSTLPCEQTPTNAPPLKCGGKLSPVGEVQTGHQQQKHNVWKLAAI
uniref:Uncharacterized protein n=1 Tax=Globodera pallida TaxID=36090 RepID=A0A183BLF4_GLOPA